MKYSILIEYPPKSGREVEWHSTKLSPAKYPEFPLLLDLDANNGKLIVITINWLSDSCYEYVRYVEQGGSWIEESLPQEFSPREANLYLPAAGLDLPSMVSLDVKREDNADFRYRKRMKQVGPKQRACGA